MCFGYIRVRRPLDTPDIAKAALRQRIERGGSSTMTAFYYCLFQSHGRQSLAEELGAPDPLNLEPIDIVDRVLGAGYTPITEILQREPFPQWGRTAEVERGGLRFLVSVSRDAEAIGVQEVRREAYADELGSA